MLLFDIVPLHNDALLVSFNKLLHPFTNEAFRLLTKVRLHHLLNDSFQDTVIFFIGLEKMGHNIYALLLMLCCKLFGHPPGTNYMIPQVIMYCDLWRSITDAHNVCYMC
jgi:hypothetical protein